MERRGRLLPHLHSLIELHRFGLRGTRVVLAILLDSDCERFQTMRILQTEMHRGIETDRRYDRVDADGGAGGTQIQRGGHGKQHHHDNDSNDYFHFFVQLSTQLRNVLYQSALFCGFRTQWPSSGKSRSSDGTLRICSAVKSSSACEYGMRKSNSPWITSVGVWKSFTKWLGDHLS